MLYLDYIHPESSQKSRARKSTFPLRPTGDAVRPAPPPAARPAPADHPPSRPPTACRETNNRRHLSNRSWPNARPTAPTAKPREDFGPLPAHGPTCHPASPPSPAELPPPDRAARQPPADCQPHRAPAEHLPAAALPAPNQPQSRPPQSRPPQSRPPQILTPSRLWAARHRSTAADPAAGPPRHAHPPSATLSSCSACVNTGRSHVYVFFRSLYFFKDPDASGAS